MSNMSTHPNISLNRFIKNLQTFNRRFRIQNNKRQIFFQQIGWFANVNCCFLLVTSNNPNLDASLNHRYFVCEANMQEKKKKKKSPFTRSKYCMVSGTRSWSLSSMAVHPINEKFCSIWLATFSTLFCVTPKKRK